ncbi:uncharacterized protein G2W53_024815 [Senna tora]|uniref:Uncharacterized protein n=1 Tax=Senna tora TaxID=362788 RepID=A0A834TCN8_9FABA|nr:uncharacterized protein G2W53_024815 [Senna tora]
MCSVLLSGGSQVPFLCAISAKSQRMDELLACTMTLNLHPLCSNNKRKTYTASGPRKTLIAIPMEVKYRFNVILETQGDPFHCAFESWMEMLGISSEEEPIFHEKGELSASESLKVECYSNPPLQVDHPTDHYHHPKQPHRHWNHHRRRYRHPRLLLSISLCPCQLS